MSVNREELKYKIEQISEQEVVKVLDFIGHLEAKREKENYDYLDVEVLSEDEELISQVQKSREDRKNGAIYDQETGLAYLREKTL